MGRGAAAAYAAVEEELFDEARWDSGPYRLLGQQEVIYAVTPAARLAYRDEEQYFQPEPQYVQHAEYEPEPDFSDLLPLPYQTYQVYQVYQEYEPEYAPGVTRSRQVRNGVLAALIALAMISTLFLVAPALARDAPLGLRFSSYRDVAAGTVAGITVQDGPPVIDTTTAVDPAGQAEAPAGSYDVLGPPTLSVDQIEKVLVQYGSPAAGLGQKLYDLGVKYNVNPAYALAFFVHESGCGTKGVARFSKSLGNIRWTEGYAGYEGYRSYSTWEAGMEDWYKLITELYIGGWGLRTVDAIIPVYAPSSDGNNPTGYIASVKYLVDSWRGR